MDTKEKITIFIAWELGSLSQDAARVASTGPMAAARAYAFERMTAPNSPYSEDDKVMYVEVVNWRGGTSSRYTITLSLDSRPANAAEAAP